MKKSSRFKEQKSHFGEERRMLLRNLEETKKELDLAYIGFNQCSDPDLIEFYLYEINALRARHTYLMRRIKASSSPASTHPISPTETLDKPFESNL